MIVKVCGITNSDDALHALGAGADWIGLNLLTGPRRIDLASARRILTRLMDPSRAVALVPAPPDPVREPLLAMLHDSGVRRLQVYGIRTPAVITQLSDAGFEIIHVVAAGKQEIVRLDTLLTACTQTRPRYVLFDAAVAGRLGGTGRRADWNLIAEACEPSNAAHLPDMILAGGLTPENVAEAIRTVRPAGVDVSSGVERTIGKKDRAGVEAFVKAVRACD